MDPNEDWSGDAQTSTDKEKEDENAISAIEQLFPGYTSFDDYLQVAFDAIRSGIKASNNFPSGENFNYYQCFPSFNAARNKEIQRLLHIMQSILGTAGVFSKIARIDVEEKFDVLLETNDIFLDRANTCMDEECGIKKNTEIELVVTQARKQNINGSWNVQNNQQLPEASESAQSIRLLAAKNIQRPQLTFKDKIDNSSKPWCPRIKDKPNSLKPLALYIEETENGEVFSHPYEFELDKFTPSDSQLEKTEPVKYKPLEDTQLIMIEKPADIKILLDDLKNHKEIAVDLEHHSYRTFQGITCLMQISTRDTDYLVDTLSLRSELHELNEIFTKPSILKVFHGADLDIQWLQRDLSLYVVNMFDTHQAAKLLNLPYLSLAYLLKRYCSVDPNKHFQLADWRIRPLPNELIKYAREDTHYLLYIKDILKNTLVDAANGQTNLLKAVYDRSTEICKKVYIKPIWTEDSYLTLYRKSQKMFNNKQLYALKELYGWRDSTARIEDDSTGYVLPNHMLLNIAETLPREMQGILACCNPIPPLVRQNLLKLHKIILKAREQPLIKPILEEHHRQRMTQGSQVSNSEAWMYSPHDIPSGTEARADLPCLLDMNENLQNLSVSHVANKHTVTVFDSPLTSEDEETQNEQHNAKKFVFVSPYERYKRVLPMVAEQEALEREKEKKEEEERLNKMKEDEEETAKSKDRVFEHFRKVAQTVNEEGERPQKRMKLSKIPLSQIHGVQRKRESNVKAEEEVQDKSSYSLTTPVPLLNAKPGQSFKKSKKHEEEAKEDQNAQGSVQDNKKKANKPKKNQSLWTREKGMKKATQKELMKKGMLPSRKFDYKSVDFSSFQGGSTNVPNQVKFEQQMKKKKEKGRKRKKQKLNI